MTFFGRNPFGELGTTESQPKTATQLSPTLRALLSGTYNTGSTTANSLAAGKHPGQVSPLSQTSKIAPTGGSSDPRNMGSTSYVPTSSGGQSQIGTTSAPDPRNMSSAATRATATGTTATSGAPSATSAGTSPVTSGGGGDPTGGTAKANTEFGQSFRKEAWNDAWADPQSVIHQYLRHVGAPTNTGGSAMTQELADNMGILWLLSQNAGKAEDPQYWNTGSYLDFAGDYLGSMRSPGGSTMGLGDVLGAMFGASEQSPLYHNLFGDDLQPGQQVDQFMKTMRYGAEPSTPALILDAYLAQANQVGKDFTADAMTGDGSQVNFGEYLKERMYT